MAGMGEDFHERPEDERNRAKRKQWFTLLGLALLVLALGAGIWWWLIGAGSVSTDNAYVAASVAQVTPLTSGTALDIPVENTQAVEKGDVLLKIDPADAKLAFDQAEAAYRLTIRKVRTYFANHAAAEAAYARAKLDYERRQRIADTDAVSKEELSAVRAAYQAAEAGLRSAEAMTANTDIDRHPEVLAAQAMRDTAKLNLERTIVRAPVSGIVAQRSVQIGQMVQAGRPVMAVVPIGAVYVEANFKEDQLAKVRPGQKAELTADLYGSDVVFHGTVVGLAGGTGSAFALIPAQNATGNWIKVVQRVPVRIALDPAELAAHPLRVGLSMAATIDITN